MTCDVLIPVLGRPANAEVVANSVLGTSPARVVFVATAGDTDEIRACERLARHYRKVELVVVEPHERGDYARKINAAAAASEAEWLFQGADDLRFPNGWLEDAIDVAARHGARVVGFPDGCNPRTRTGAHSTHNLVAASYVREVGTTDEPGKMLHEGYWHNYVDDELVLSARQRGEFAFARRVTIRHLHPNCAETELDATYERALDKRAFAADRQLLRRRKAMIVRAARVERRRRPSSRRRHGRR